MPQQPYYEDTTQTTPREPCARCGTPIPGIVAKADPMCIPGRQNPPPGTVIYHCYSCGHVRRVPPAGAIPDALNPPAPGKE